MLRTTSVLFLALAFGVAATAVAQETPTPLTRDQIAAVVAGEVLVETERGDLNRGQVIGLVRAPLAEVSTIVRDTENHDQWFPDTVESAATNGGSNTSVTTGRTHLPLLRDRYWRLNGRQSSVTYNGVGCELMTYEYDHGYADGNMEELHGYWLLCPEGDSTIVKYVINADLGVWLPAAIVNWAQRRLLPGIISGLEERHAELY